MDATGETGRTKDSGENTPTAPSRTARDASAPNRASARNSTSDWNEDRLADLGMVFLGLAIGADDQLHFREVDVLADILGRWCEGASRDRCTSYLDAAARLFREDKVAAEARVTGSLEALNEVLSTDEKRLVLDDLTRIGLADRRFLYEEAAYIERVANAWTIRIRRLSHETESVGQLDIFGETLIALATLYLVFAFVPDEQISEEEREKVRDRLAQWVPDAAPKDVDHAVRTALSRMSSPPTEGSADSALRMVKDRLPRHQYTYVFDDLKRIACADRVMAVEERTLLERLGHAG